MGITAEILKTRVKTPTVGRWSSGFSKVKKYADENEIPIIAVWTNGDCCGHCVFLEYAAMTSEFKKWQKTSGCVFWLGTSSDTTKDDKYEGTGFMWSGKMKSKHSLAQYPFVRVWWKRAGKVVIDKCEPGDYYIWKGTERNDGKEFRDKLKKVLKKFINRTDEPAPEPTPTPTPEPEPETTDVNLSEEEKEELQNSVTTVPETVDDGEQELLLREKLRSEIDLLNEIFLQRYHKLQSMNRIAEEIVGDGGDQTQ